MFFNIGTVLMLLLNNFFLLFLSFIKSDPLVQTQHVYMFKILPRKICILFFKVAMKSLLLLHLPKAEI